MKRLLITHKNLIVIASLFFVFSLGFLGGLHEVSAQHILNPVEEDTESGELIGELKNPLAGADIHDIPTLIERILEIAITIGVPVVVLMLIYTGFLFVTARGNEQRLTDAKNKLKWVLVGAAVLLGAWVIASAIQATVDSITTAVS